MKRQCKIRAGRSDAKKMDKGWIMEASLESKSTQFPEKTGPENQCEQKTRSPGYTWSVGSLGGRPF